MFRPHAFKINTHFIRCDTDIPLIILMIDDLKKRWRCRFEGRLWLFIRHHRAFKNCACYESQVFIFNRLNSNISWNKILSIYSAVVVTEWHPPYKFHLSFRQEFFEKRYLLCQNISGKFSLEFDIVNSDNLRQPWAPFHPPNKAVHSVLGTWKKNNS